jgi:hypothetical protein
MSSNVYRGIIDFINHPLINQYRDVDWERWIRTQKNAPYNVPRYETREEAYQAIQTIPVMSGLSCVESKDFMLNVIIPFIEQRQSLDKHMCFSNNPYTDSSPVLVKDVSKELRRTFDFVWNVLRSGIIVAVYKKRVICFCPFFNPNYTNSWPVGTLGNSEDRPHVLPKKNWWCNGGIICNEYYPWGTHFCMQLKDMISEVVDRFNISDAVFCINKRDHPQYKYNDSIDLLVEPYGFVYDANDHDPQQDVPLSMHIRKNDVLPMMSFYGGKRFLDVLIPPTEDYEASTRRVYLPDYSCKIGMSRTSIRDLTSAVPLTIEPMSSKKGVAFFRGSCTGSGRTIFTNQRLRLFTFAHELQSDLLDVRCTSLNNNRLRKHYLEQIGGISSSVGFPVSDTFYVPMSEQIRHRYLIYVEGHCAACRLGIMLSSGCVVLKVQSSTVASELWFTSKLNDFEHYISIREDLSDLMEKIEFLENNQDTAQYIANSARKFWEDNLSHESLLSYVHESMNNL